MATKGTVVPTALQWSRINADGLRQIESGDLTSATPTLHRAVQMAERMPESGERLACSLFALGRVYRMVGRLDEAERAMRRALHAESHALGQSHPYTRKIAGAQVTILRRAGRTRAAAHLERVLAADPRPREGIS
ncbi:MAG: tetratricopeptide repeat protein [Chloroflexi bacterium]|nr:tetratricopeptide repeat protein [Chloroflexota bacterium]